MKNQLCNKKTVSPCLEQIEVTVELRALGVFQTLELTGDEQENVLDIKTVRN